MKLLIEKSLNLLAVFGLLITFIGCGKKVPVTSSTADLTTSPATLIRAIAYGSPSDAPLLLKNGADPNGAIGRGTTQITPLMVASALGKIEFVSLLLNYNADRSASFMSYKAEDIAFYLNHREILALLSEGN